MGNGWELDPALAIKRFEKVLFQALYGLSVLNKVMARLAPRQRQGLPRQPVDSR
jgi:hypothetical protein